MGVVSYDKNANTKKYENKYTLSTTKGVQSLLKDTHALHSRAYDRGDMAAIDLLVDLATAIEAAKLTDKQLTAITLYYGEDLAQDTVAKRMNCDSTTVSRHRKAALKRITEVYKTWEYGG